MEALVTVFAGDLALPFFKTGEDSSSCFGGSATVISEAPSYGPKSLHQVGFLSASDLASVCLPSEQEGLPLVYGLCYDGCLLKYKFARGAAHIESIVPSLSSDDWPYPSYPSVFPRTPLRAGAARREARTELAVRWPQVRSLQDGECLVVVPPPEGLAYSLWGAGGDSEGVTLLFYCSWSSKTVVAENVCA